MGIVSSYFETAQGICSTCNQAAMFGNLAELKRLHEEGKEWNEETCYWAASKSLECLKYCHENGCPWDYQTTTYAASNGKIDCLKYAVENGCQILEFAPSIACQNSDIETFKICFQLFDHTKNDFWKYPHYYKIDNILDEIDLDDPMWKSLFDANLKEYPSLEQKVKAKKEEIEAQNAKDE